MKEKLLKELKKDYKVRYGVKMSKEVEEGAWFTLCYLDDRNEFANKLGYASMSTGPNIIWEDVKEKKLK